MVWSSAALAQPAGAQAEVLFRQGRDLLAAGKVADACVAFEESQKLQPAVTTLLNLAGCREKLGQLATAWGLFLDAVRATRSATDAAGQQLHGVAQTHADKLEPRVSKLTINVPQQSQVDGLEITRGRERVESALWNRALPIDGGTYTITARAPGANPWSTRVTVAAEGDTRTVQIPDLHNLPRDLDRPPPPPPPAAVIAPEPASESPSVSRPVLPLVVGAGALALLGSGLGFELWGDSKYSAAKSELNNEPHREALYNAATTRRYTAEAFAACGLVAGGAAIWLYVRDRSRERDPAIGTRVRVVPSPTGLALAGSF
jgi:serine/threonine-protein kinase